MKPASLPRFTEWKSRMRYTERDELGGHGNGLQRPEKLSGDELAAKERWQQEMRYQDEVAGKIEENAGILKQHAHVIGDALEGQVAKLDAVDAVVNKAEKELETSTKRAKRLLQKVREGDKCCVTLVLLLLLIGLCTVAFNMITHYSIAARRFAVLVASTD